MALGPPSDVAGAGSEPAVTDVPSLSQTAGAIDSVGLVRSVTEPTTTNRSPTAAAACGLVVR